MTNNFENHKKDTNVTYEYYDEYNDDEFYFFYDEDVGVQGIYNIFGLTRQ